MRYYKIVVSDPAGIKPPRTWTSLNTNGTTNTAAQNVEFDIPLSTFATPASAAYVRIWGVSLADIGQASDFNNMDIAVYGGMAKGLPLANPSQNGLLVQGTILQAFGNWIGTQQTLDFEIMPQTSPQNITLTWRKGTELIPAIQQTLTNSFKGYTLDTSGVVEQSGFILTEDQIGYFDNIAQFATWIKQVSAFIKPVLPANGVPYSGLDVMVHNNKLILLDNSGVNVKTPRQINFQDLIGQPTWIGLYQLQFNCIMRADLSLGDFILMPKAVFTTTQASYSQYRQRSAFQGVFQILGDKSIIRHVGNFRAPNGESWVTTINAVQIFTKPPQVDLIGSSSTSFAGSVA